MNISYEVKQITPRVKDHRGYTDMIFDLTVSIDFIDADTESTIGYQLFHKFDTEIQYDEENSFIPFEDITENQINLLVDFLIENERVGGQITLQEWAESRFTEIYSQPIYKPFSFDVVPEPIGIGISPIMSSDQETV